MPINQLTIDVDDVDFGMRDIIDELQSEEPDHVDTGVLADEGEELVIIAAANEFGATIAHPGGTPYGYRTRRDAVQGKMRFLKKGRGFMVLGVTGPHEIVIPARSYIRSTVDESEEKIMDTATTVARRIAAGEATKTDLLQTVGMLTQSLIQRKITSLRDPANAPSTIRKKGSSNPLIDTGRLRQSISFQLGTSEETGESLVE